MSHIHIDNETSNNDTELRTSSDSPVYIPQAYKFKQVILLKYSQFVQLLNIFNQTLDKFTRDEPFYLRFSIVRHTDSTILWKALIRIRCSKVSRTDQNVSDEVVLNLQQFLSVYQSLSQQISVLYNCPSSTLYNSTRTNKTSSSSFSTGKSSFMTLNDKECCICMDRSPNLVLPCSHKFCDKCFHQWSTQPSSASYHTCPICREHVKSDSGYILAETPKYDSVRKTLIESILSLPIDYKTRNRSVRRNLSSRNYQE